MGTDLRVRRPCQSASWPPACGTRCALSAAAQTTRLCALALPSRPLTSGAGSPIKLLNALLCYVALSCSFIKAIQR